MQAPGFQSSCQQLDTKWSLLGVLEPMCGLAGCVRVAYVHEFFGFLLPILRVCVSLLELYTGVGDVVAVILELFVLVSENYTVFLDQVCVIRVATEEVKGHQRDWLTQMG